MPVRNKYKIGDVLKSYPFCTIRQASALADQERSFCLQYDRSLAPEGIREEMEAWLQAGDTVFPAILETESNESGTTLVVPDIPAISIKDSLLIRDLRTTEEKILSFLPELVKIYEELCRLQLEIPADAEKLAGRMLCQMNGKIRISPAVLQNLFVKVGADIEPLRKSPQGIEPASYLLALGSLLSFFSKLIAQSGAYANTAPEYLFTRETAELIRSLSQGEIKTFDAYQKAFLDLPANKPPEKTPAVPEAQAPPLKDSPILEGAEKIIAPLKQLAPPVRTQAIRLRNFFYRIQPSSPMEILHFTDRLSMMMDAGVPIHRSLQILAEQAESGGFKSALVGVTELIIRRGRSIADAMRQYPQYFSEAYVSIVSVGEATGKLSQSLRRIAQYLDRTITLTRKTKAALVYPFFILVACALLFCVFMYITLPRLIDVFTSLHVQYALPTRIVLEAVTLAHSPEDMLPFLVGFVAFIVFLWLFLKSDSGIAQADRLLLKLPIVRRLYKELILTRFSSSLSTLLETGTSFLQALPVSERTTGSVEFRKIVQSVEDEVRKGVPIAEAFEEHLFFPALFCDMAKVGEESGKLPFMLLKVSQIFEDEVNRRIQQALVLVEPLIVLLMGGLVGFTIIGMVLPIYGIATRLMGQ